jgi:predicted amino acid dehydrogenase
MTDEQLNARLDAIEQRIIEAMRDMQTELLRGFDAFSTGQTLRIRKVEADQSNLDASLSGRVEIVEKRLLQIEQRLGR